MAPRAESAYERRIRRYLEAHPGATRQEARGHRPRREGESEYGQRVRRYLQRHPGASRQEAGGKAPRRERVGAGPRRRGSDLRRYVHAGDLVLLADHIRNVQRTPNGWAEIELMVVPDDPSRETRTFTIGNLSDAQLARLIRDLEDEGAVLTPVPSLDVRRLT